MALGKLWHVIVVGIALMAIDKAGADPETDLQENLKERREMLVKALNQRIDQWQAGKGTLNPLKDDLRALVKVNSELYSTKKDRAFALEECVQRAKDLAEAVVSDRLATAADGLEVKVLLLEILEELQRERNRPEHARDLNSLTKENFDKIKPGKTTYKEAVELLGEPDGTNLPLARGEWLQAIWIDGSRRINIAFDNDIVRLKPKATGIPGVAP
jgi:hypothetical protein